MTLNLVEKPKNQQTKFYKIIIYASYSKANSFAFKNVVFQLFIAFQAKEVVSS